MPEWCLLGKCGTLTGSFDLQNEKGKERKKSETAIILTERFTKKEKHTFLAAGASASQSSLLSGVADSVLSSLATATAPRLRKLRLSTGGGGGRGGGAGGGQNTTAGGTFSGAFGTSPFTRVLCSMAMEFTSQNDSTWWYSEARSRRKVASSWSLLAVRPPRSFKTRRKSTKHSSFMRSLA